MPAAIKLMFSDPAEIRALRKKMGMNQAEFWLPLGITQSGGSRYETGRNIPESVRILLHLAYAPPAKAEKLLGALRGQERVGR
jgi:DNA-binding transcriptional regulator YiaG